MNALQTCLVIVWSIATSLSCCAQDREVILDDLPLAPCRFASVALKGGFTDTGSGQNQEIASLVHRPPRIDEISLLNKRWVQDELALMPTEARYFRGEYDRILDSRKPVPADLSQSLDSKQVKKLLDIRIRCRVRAMGIVEFFSLPELELSNDELKAIRDLVKELDPVYAKLAADLRDESLEKFREVLTKDQQAQLDKWSSGFLESRLPPLDLLMWQMSNVDRFDETIADKDFPEFRGFFCSMVYFVDYDGVPEEIEGYLGGGRKDLKKKLSEREQMVKDDYLRESFFRKLHRIITDQSTSAEILLTDEQAQAANILVGRLGLFESEWREKIWAIRNAGEQDRSSDYAKYERLKSDLVAEGTRELEAILLPHQSELLETMSILMEVLNGGLPGALVFGQTGKALNLTTTQKSEVEKICESSIAEMEAQTRRWEQEIFVKLKDVLSDSNKQNLEFLFKCPVSNGRVNICLLLNGGL